MALKLSTGLRNAMLDAGSFQDTLANGIIYIYTGSQPDVDAAATGTLLLKITVASGSFSHGTSTNGLNFADASAGAVAKTSAVWSGVAEASGTAGWFRYCANAVADGPTKTSADTPLPKRFDGSISTSGAQLNLSSTSITLGATTTIDSFTVTLPAS